MDLRINVLKVEGKVLPFMSGKDSVLLMNPRMQEVRYAKSLVLEDWKP